MAEDHAKSADWRNDAGDLAAPQDFRYTKALSTRMALISSFNEDRPVSYFRGYPIYYATLITAAYALGVIITALIEAFRADLAILIFSPDQSILGGRLWQILTCTFVNPPNFFILFSLFFIYVTAVETEKYIGATRFLSLYAILLAVPVVLQTLWRLSLGNDQLHALYYAGNTEVLIGFFLAYCTLYPNLQWFGLIPMKWLAIVSIAIGSLIHVSGRDWIGLIILLLVCGSSFGYIRFLQFGGQLPSFPKLFRDRSRPKLRVVPRPKPRVSQDARKVDSSEIDQLLDKISKQGLASLTPQERAALERAREKLLEKDGK